MSRRVNASAGRSSRRWNTILWLAGLAAITIVLIRFEQTEILYILATLGVTALLAVVAMADLKGSESMTGETALGDDAAAIGSGMQGTLAGTAKRKASRK